MKKLALVVAIMAQAGWVSADSSTAEDSEPYEEIIIGAHSAPILVEDGAFWVETENSRVGYTDFNRAKSAAMGAGKSPELIERLEERGRFIDELGLGNLERLALGIPRYVDVKMFRGANTDLLFSMLGHAELAADWRYIAWTIGAVADEAAAKKLADYLSSPPSTSLATHSPSQSYLDVRRSGFLGLTIAIRDQPMPWVNEYLMTHADPDQWVKIFKAENIQIEKRLAKNLAASAAIAISHIVDGDPLAMLQEVRERQLSKLPVQPLAAGKKSEEVTSALEYVDAAIRQAKRQAEARANPDNNR